MQVNVAPHQAAAPAFQGPEVHPPAHRDLGEQLDPVRMMLANLKIHAENPNSAAHVTQNRLPASSSSPEQSSILPLLPQLVGEIASFLAPEEIDNILNLLEPEQVLRQQVTTFAKQRYMDEAYLRKCIQNSNGAPFSIKKDAKTELLTTRLAAFEQLDLQGCPVTAATLLTVKKLCPKLQRLNLTKATFPTALKAQSEPQKKVALEMEPDAETQAMLQQLLPERAVEGPKPTPPPPVMETAQEAMCSAMQVVATFPHLVQLSLELCPVDDAAVSLLASSQSLVDLDLTGTHITGEAMALAKTLQRIILKKCSKLSDDGLRSVGKLRELQHVSLSCCSTITDTGIQHLSQLTKMLHLDLASCRAITDMSLQHISGMQKMQHLDLINCIEITDVGLQQISTLVEIRFLRLSSCRNITNTGLHHLRQMTQMEYLALNGCHQITDDGLQHLSAMTKMRHLFLSVCYHIVGTGLIHLVRMTEMQTLDLKNCWELTDQGLQHIQAMIQMEDLDLYGCRKITDACLQYVSEMKELHTLSLEKCPGITSASLPHLVQLTGLRTLVLSETRWSDPVKLQELRKRLPQLHRLYHDA